VFGTPLRQFWPGFIKALSFLKTLPVLRLSRLCFFFFPMLYFHLTSKQKFKSSCSLNFLVAIEADLYNLFGTIVLVSVETMILLSLFGTFSWEVGFHVTQ
jgi:hypothetical protein